MYLIFIQHVGKYVNMITSLRVAHAQITQESIMSNLETELQTYIDKSTSSGSAENAFISIDEFDAMLSNKNHDHLTDKIVAALGGIDKMLIEYIRITREHENEELLSGPDMQKIAKIISTAPTAPIEMTESMWDYLYKRAKLMDNTFHFSSSETVWHSIFTDPQVADRIVVATFSKFTWTFVGAAFAIWMTCIALAIQVGSTKPSLLLVEGLYSGTALAMLSILVPFLVLMILCCNIPSLLLILCSFDFWMKVGYSIILIIAGCIRFIRLQGPDAPVVWVAILALSAAVIVLVICNVSLIEGYHGNWKVAFIFGLIMSLVFSWGAVANSFNTNNSEEHELELWPGYSIVLNEWIASCFRVLSLFLWKQTLMAAYTRGEWCICIYLSPYIKWVDGDIDVIYRSQSDVNSKK